jgi:choice-of-anchor B domain-containing protein
VKRFPLLGLLGSSLLLVLAVSGGALDAQEPNFGRAVAVNGGDLVIGQPVNWYGPGIVYAYRATAEGGWSETVRLTAPDSSRMDDFGGAVALDDWTLAVGAPRKRDGVGVVYVFQRSREDLPWEHTATIEPPAAGDHREFGAALTIDGEELLVGSPRVNGTGVVYRYLRADGTEAGGWRLHETFAPEEGGVGRFGAALTRGEERVLIGAPGTDEGRGAAFVLERAGHGWTAPIPLPLPDGLGERAGFGAATALEGAHAIVGSPGQGAVFAYAHDGMEWGAPTTLRAFEAEEGSLFGFALDATPDALWVGAPGARGRDGRVYRFALDGTVGFRAAERVDPDRADGTSWPLGFGYALAVEGDRAVVGMPSRDFGEGRALAFRRAGTEWSRGSLLEGRIFRLGEELASGDLCTDGAMAEFPCTNLELVAHVPIDALGGERGAWLNDVWGWEDPGTGRRYALVARRDGASFVDVTEPASPRLVGTMARTDGSRPSVWRDIKVIGTHAFIVADGAGAHGMQIFDLTRLRDVEEPVEFDPDVTYREFWSAHNVVADTASGFVYVVGANSGGRTCGGGLHMVDVSSPLSPSFAGCYTDAAGTGRRGYTHDAQCVVYHGPDERYVGRQICLGSNATELNIADVTDKQNPVTVARATYPNVSYAHQGWLDDEHRYFYMNDEGDETAGVVERTRTLVWDLTELDDPILEREYFGPVPASDHNLFVSGDLMYQANYGSGLRVLDISDRGNPVEIAHFDSAPYNDDEPGFSAAQSGAWSNYPFFGDGLVVFTSVREGLFLVRVRRPIT